MVESYWTILIALAACIIIALATYAVCLLKQLKQQTHRQKEAEQKHQQALKKHDSKVLDSVVIIVRAMKEEQCDISEGCWRLCVLLDSLKTSNELSLKFPAIFELYTAIKHMPILEERKKLEKKQRMRFDLERAKVEAKLQPSVHVDIHTLHDYALERLKLLSQ